MSDDIREQINKIRKIEKTLFENKETINESGYARVANIMRGLIPNVNTLAFISAENPFGKQTDSSFNKDANVKLEEKLRSMNLGFSKVKGKYGNKENTYFIPNITKDETLNIGKLFRQESIIFGEKNLKDNYDGFTFQMIYTDHRFGEIIGEIDVFVNKQNADDYYSSVKGRKFQIPFFDEDFLNAKFKQKSGLIDKNNIDESVIVSLNKQINEILNPNTTDKSRWINRGDLKTKLKSLLK